MKQNRAERTRQAIFEAALKAFAAHGFAGCSVDSIAAEAAANKQRIYAYFGSKKKLFETVLLEVFRAMSEEFESFAGKVVANDPELSRKVCGYFLSLHEKHPEFHRLLSWANLEDAITPEILNQARLRENQCLKDWFQMAQQAGTLRPDVSFESWLLVLMGSSYFVFANYCTLKQSLGEAFLTPEIRERMAEELNKVFARRSVC